MARFLRQVRLIWLRIVIVRSPNSLAGAKLTCYSLPHVDHGSDVLLYPLHG